MENKDIGTLALFYQIQLFELLWSKQNLENCFNAYYVGSNELSALIDKSFNLHTISTECLVSTNWVFKTLVKAQWLT